jgi:glycosyltransferase involved in cell wall biosynthesis
MLAAATQNKTNNIRNNHEAYQKRLKIVHFQRRPFSGNYSIEGLFANLRDAMRELNHDVELAVAPHHSRGFWRRLAMLVWARRNKGDVNHITGDIHFIALALNGENTILTIHDCQSLERLRGLKRWLLKLLWFELPVRRARYVTVISEETKRCLQRHVRGANKKIRVIPDAVSPIYRAVARRFNTERPRILHIGTKENKNLSRLIQALAGIRCHLHIIGQLRDQQTDELRVAGVDFSVASDLSEAQMYDAYCAADLVCFVSTYEGFGLPILEANAVGRPVVTSNLSSMPEVAGPAACLVDPYNVMSIRAGIRQVLDDPEYRNELVRQGFRNASRFCAHVVAQEYLALYREVASCSVPVTSQVNSRYA